MGCVFCATGQMGFERNMKAEEIVGQVIHFAKILSEKGQHVTNIVFMGMGEPLANYAETFRAIRLLTHPRGFGIGQRHITISTIGIVSAIEKLAEEKMHRITSYNVCYTKLLRVLANSQESAYKISKSGYKSVTLEGEFFEANRITSYNVCYTKLLRNFSV